MNIVYGVCGEGLGHTSRALVTIPFLQKLGHKVKVITDDRAYETLKEKFDAFEIRGLHMVFKDDALHKARTVFHNIRHYPKNILRSRKIRNLMRAFKPDVFITDYEITTYFLSKIYRKPLISIGNHYIINFLKMKVPKEHRRDYLLTRFINRMFTPSADYFVITSFLKKNLRNKKLKIVAPIVREEVRRLKSKKGSKILVYLRKADYIVEILKKVNAKFIVYGDFEKTEKNIEFKKLGLHGSFLKDLSECRAIISTAGFSMISEALYLKKPIFVVPQRGSQFEQVFNALTLKDEGFGDFSLELKKEDIEKFLGNLKKFEKNLGENKFDYDEIYSVLREILKNYSNNN